MCKNTQLITGVLVLISFILKTTGNTSEKGKVFINWYNPYNF